MGTPVARYASNCWTPFDHLITEEQRSIGWFCPAYAMLNALAGPLRVRGGFNSE